MNKTNNEIFISDSIRIPPLVSKMLSLKLGLLSEEEAVELSELALDNDEYADAYEEASEMLAVWNDAIIDQLREAIESDSLTNLESAFKTEPLAPSIDTPRHEKIDSIAKPTSFFGKLNVVLATLCSMLLIAVVGVFMFGDKIQLDTEGGRGLKQPTPHQTVPPPKTVTITATIKDSTIRITNQGNSTIYYHLMVADEFGKKNVFVSWRTNPFSENIGSILPEDIVITPLKFRDDKKKLLVIVSSSKESFQKFNYSTGYQLDELEKEFSVVTVSEN